MKVFKRTTFFFKRTLFSVFNLFFILLLSSCSSTNDDNGDTTDDGSGTNEEEIMANLEELSGEYSGLASNSTTNDDISMRIKPTSAEGQYAIEFFGFNDLTPCCNSNNRPDGTGSLSVENDQLSIRINWRSDSPPCSGTYTGSRGTFGLGRVIIDMAVDLNCLESEFTQTFNLMKIADL